MSPHRFAPGRLFGVQHSQVFAAVPLSLWFSLRAHFVVFPFELRVVLLKHGSKNIHRDGSTMHNLLEPFVDVTGPR